MERRDFLRWCAAGAAGAATAEALAVDAAPVLYPAARLVDEHGTPLKARDIPVGRNLIFHYPFAATPCFLLNLGQPLKAGARLKTADGRAYAWNGGVGAARSVVAYSAICSHQLAYPTKDISFISFRAEPGARNPHARVIHCCAEHSQYDPADGGRVVAGPAPQPLAAILLEHDAKTDELTAKGTLGGEMFRAFFARYEFKLAMEHGGSARREVNGTAVVRELEQFCRQQVRC